MYISSLHNIVLRPYMYHVQSNDNIHQNLIYGYIKISICPNAAIYLLFFAHARINTINSAESGVMHTVTYVSVTQYVAHPFRQLAHVTMVTMHGS